MFIYIAIHTHTHTHIVVCFTMWFECVSQKFIHWKLGSEVMVLRWCIFKRQSLINDN
jgi:hypothetical protein